MLYSHSSEVISRKQLRRDLPGAALMTEKPLYKHLGQRSRVFPIAEIMIEREKEDGLRKERVSDL